MVTSVSDEHSASIFRVENGANRFLLLHKSVYFYIADKHILDVLVPLWSSGQSFRLQIQRSRVRFPALPDFLTSRGSGTGSTQPRDHN
jgi:hypothetical protein